MPAAAQRRVMQDRGIRNSVIALVIGFGIFIGWSAFAGLDEGVTASGLIVVQDNRKAVQHFEGGIVSKLNVHEGDHVEKGDILLELEPIQSEAARDELAQDFAVQTATLERLLALRADRDVLTFQSIRQIDLPDATKLDITGRQAALFNQQRAAHNAELSVLETRKQTVIGRQADLSNQIAATRRQLLAARKDLKLRRELLAEKLETIGNVAQLEREVAGLEATASRLVGDQNEAAQSEQEIKDQVLEAKARFQEQISEQIVETQAKVLATRERLQALDDRLSRTVIRAPQGGTVLNLAYTTIGGVVGAGNTILEIVPDTDKLVAKVKLSPTDRDAVTKGQRVRAQMTAYKTYMMKQLDGEVLSISADLKTDEASGAMYYEAQIALDTSELSADDRILIIPGMPVSAFITSGTKRSFLDYVFEPILKTFRTGTRMS